MALLWDGQHMLSQPDVVVAPAPTQPAPVPIIAVPNLPKITVAMVSDAIATHKSFQQHWTGLFNVPPVDHFNNDF